MNIQLLDYGVHGAIFFVKTVKKYFTFKYDQSVSYDTFIDNCIIKLESIYN